MVPSTADENRRRFERLRDAFGRAGGAAAPAASSHRFAAAEVRFRVAGETLCQHIEAPFAHLRVPPSAAAPALAIDLWDVRETGVAGLEADAAHAVGREWDLGDAPLASSPDARFVSYGAGGGVAWFDREAPRIVGWYQDGTRLSLHQRGRPLQMLLALWASDRGLQPVHAALVARDGRGVLIAGRSGAGKSTVALACLEAGYTYLGDDWAAIETSGASAIGYGLYGSAFLEAEHARRFARVHAGFVRPSERDAKSFVLLSRSFPERLGTSARVVALALPRLVDVGPSSFRPASKKEALLAMVPSSILTMQPRGGREGVGRLAGLVRDLPAYCLDVGRSIEGIAPCIEALLAAAGR